MKQIQNHTQNHTSKKNAETKMIGKKMGKNALWILSSVFLCAYLPSIAIAKECSLGVKSKHYKTHIGKSGRQSIVEFFTKGSQAKTKIYAYGYANVDGSGPKKDIKNPNPKLRERVDKGAVFVYGLSKVDNDKCVYEGGEVYNYDDGKTYHLKITIESNGNLTLRASLDKNGWLGETLVWTPLSESDIAKYEGEKPDFSVVETSYNALPANFKP